MGPILAGMTLVSMGFFAGRLSSPHLSEDSRPPHILEAMPLLIQDNDPRELQPLPGPGQGFGLPQGSEECPLYFFDDGQFFQMQPGQGFPGQEGSPELFPLQPLPGTPGNPRQPSPRPIPEQFSQVDSPILMASSP